MVEIFKFINVLQRYMWLIVLATIVSVGATYYATGLIPPIYTSTAIIRVLSISEGQISYPLFDTIYSNQLMNTYAIVGTSQDTLDDLVSLLALDAVPDIDIDVLENTELLRITVENKNPETATLIANTLAELLVANSTELVSGQGPNSSDLLSSQLDQIEEDLNFARSTYAQLIISNEGDEISLQSMEVDIAQQEVEFLEQLYFTFLSQFQQVRTIELVGANVVSIVNDASVPSKPTSPNLLINLVIGTVVGFVGGMALAVILDLLDNRFHSVEEIETFTGLPTLARILKLPGSARPIAVNSYPYGEDFRRFRLNLLSVLKSRTLLIISAEPRDGRSFIVMNLAQSLIQLHHSIVIIDCDARKPARDDPYEHLIQGPTLLDLLTQSVSLTEALQELDGIEQCVIPSGQQFHSVAELLASPKMTALINNLESRFNYVLIDTPAYLGATDAAILSHKLKDDGIIVVVRNKKTSRNSVSMMLDTLRSHQIGILGTVINYDNSNHYKRFTRYYNKNTFVTQPSEKQLKNAFHISEKDYESLNSDTNYSGNLLTDNLDRTQPVRTKEFQATSD